MIQNNTFIEIAKNQIPRILGLGDRDNQSKTFGCFDRYYWHYKIIDFPNSRFQEASLLMALIYLNDFEDNKFYKNTSLLQWIKGTISFWTRIQNRDGSFNEVYPFERSVCASSFSTYSITETLINLNNLIDLEPFLKPIIKTGHWLLKNDSIEVSNQTAGAALALYNIYLLTKNSIFQDGCNKKINLLIEILNKNGFFPEYDGFDIGYSSLTLTCLAMLYKKNEDENLKKIIIDQDKYLDEYIDEYGDFDILKTSRKAQYLYPFGFSMFNSQILKKIERGNRVNQIPNPSWLDDRYTISLTTNYLQTHLNVQM